MTDKMISLLRDVQTEIAASLAESGLAGAIRIGQSLEANQAWGLMPTGSPIADINGFTLHVGRVTPMADYFGAAGSVNCPTPFHPEIFTGMSFGFGVRSLGAIPIWHSARNVTIVFVPFGKKDSGVNYYTADGDPLVHDSSTVNAVTWPYAYLASDHKTGLFCVPHAASLDEPQIVIPSRQNYYHFIIDHLPYFLMLAETPGRFGRGVICHRLTDLHRQILSFFGVETSAIRVIDADCTEHLHSGRFRDALIPASLPFPISVEIIRQHLARLGIGSGVGGKRRIFLGRAPVTETGSRMINQLAVRDALKAYGFEFVLAEDLTFAEQVTLFSEAAIVIGCNGAGLTNIIFSSKDTICIEIRNEPCDQDKSGVFNPIYKLSACLGQLHYRLVFPVEPGAAQPHLPDRPYRCDIPRLTALIDWILSDPRNTGA